jgi:hypothetical protein
MLFLRRSTGTLGRTGETMRATAIVICVAFGFGTSLAPAKISHVHFDELVQLSDQIVIATVTRVTVSTSGPVTVRHASAVVSHTLKGQDLRHLQFNATTGDFEDSSDDAKVGEQVLLFLNRSADGGYGIALAGRGRMPLRQVNHKTYATLWNDVVLPEGAPVIPGPDPKYTFIVSVELSYLEKLIAKYRHLNRAA